MHDFAAKSIKLFLIDPKDPAKRKPVLLSLAHLVRMEPEDDLESEGRRMVTPVEDKNATQQRRGIKRSFIIYDDIGGRYESRSASREAQAMLERLWAESV